MTLDTRHSLPRQQSVRQDRPGARLSPVGYLRDEAGKDDACHLVEEDSIDLGTAQLSGAAILVPRLRSPRRYSTVLQEERKQRGFGTCSWRCVVLTVLLSAHSSWVPRAKSAGRDALQHSRP